MNIGKQYLKYGSFKANAVAPDIKSIVDIHFISKLIK